MKCVFILLHVYATAWMNYFCRVHARAGQIFGFVANNLMKPLFAQLSCFYHTVHISFYLVLIV